MPRHIGCTPPCAAHRGPVLDSHMECRESLRTPELWSHSEMTCQSQIYPKEPRSTPQKPDLPQGIANQSTLLDGVLLDSQTLTDWSACDRVPLIVDC